VFAKKLRRSIKHLLLRGVIQRSQTTARIDRKRIRELFL
jgi:hypothetical protein